MRNSVWDRAAASSGIAFVILFVVGAIIIGTPPEVSEGPGAVVSFFEGERDRILTGTFVMGIGVLAMLLFVGTLVTHMREVRHSTLADTALASFTLAFAVGAVAAITRAALAYSLAEAMPADTVRGVYHATLVLDTMSGLLLAGFVAAVGAAMMHHEFLPTWFGWLSGAVAVYLCVSATAWATSGFWSPTGGLALLTYVVFFVWTVVASALCIYELTGERLEHHQQPMVHA